MRMGVALWNHRDKDLVEKVEFFAAAGFQAVSALGGQFVQLDEPTGDALAAALRRHDLALTVHHKLPYGSKPPTPEEFPAHLDAVLRWQRRHRLLTGFTFDVDASLFDQWLPHLRETLSAFRGEDTFIACEDFPLDAAARERMGGLDREFANLAILVDLGHMNLRLTKALGQTLGTSAPQSGEALRGRSAADVERYLRAIPLPIRELHVHNNDGLRDQHQHLGAGTLPIAAAGRTLHAMGFDGISTIEFVPSWNDIPSAEGYPLALESAETWANALKGANA